jgi:circadian clock protein KaiC
MGGRWKGIICMTLENPQRRVTSLVKVPTGIEGLDEILNGGLPKGRTTLLTGGAGSGKTVLALQTLVNGARLWGEAGIFVAFEENSHQIFTNADSFEWDLPGLERDKLFFLDARLSSDVIAAGQFDLQGMLASLKAKADEIGAKRIVFDSIDVLLSLMDDPNHQRRELYRLHDWLAENQFSGILTARTDGDSLSIPRNTYTLQFISDCYIHLNQRLENHISLRSLRVVKYRGSGFAENEFPFVIGDRGAIVLSFGDPEVDYEVFTERVSSGIEELDSMLEGGYLRATSVLVTGAPGTAKSTLAAAFLMAALERGEKGMYVSFDEGAKEIVRNMASIDLDLGSHVNSGALLMYSARVEARSGEEHLVEIRRLIQEHRPGYLVIDPLSAIVKAGGLVNALGIAQNLINMAKCEGITMLMTSLLEGNDPEQEATPMAVSTIADTWIQLSYIVLGGERNRALTIVKSRGTGHSNQVRELILSDTGITLADVFTAGGQVLMGTLRYQHELNQELEQERMRGEVERRKRELEAAEAAAEARIHSIQQEIEAVREEMATLKQKAAEVDQSFVEQRESTRRLRRGNTG